MGTEIVALLLLAVMTLVKLFQFVWARLGVNWI